MNILTECLLLGCQNTIIKCNNYEDVLDTEGNHIPQEPTFDPLYQASQLTLIRHINNIVNQMPIPHQMLTHEGSQVSDPNVRKNARYVEKMEDFFSDTSWTEEVFKLTSVLNVYLVTLTSFPWQPEVANESLCDICRFCVLCSEVSLIGYYLNIHLSLICILKSG